MNYSQLQQIKVDITDIISNPDKSGEIDLHWQDLAFRYPVKYMETVVLLIWSTWQISA